LFVLADAKAGRYEVLKKPRERVFPICGIKKPTWGRPENMKPNIGEPNASF